MTERNNFGRDENQTKVDVLKASLETQLLGRGVIDFQYDGLPATIRVERREDEYFQYESEAVTRFVNARGNIVTRPMRCISKGLNGILEQIPESILLTVASRLSEIEPQEQERTNQQRIRAAEVEEMHRTGRVPRGLRMLKADSF